MLRKLKSLSHEEMLRELESFSLEKAPSRNWADEKLDFDLFFMFGSVFVARLAKSKIRLVLKNHAELLVLRRPEEICGHESSCLSRNFQEHLWNTKTLLETVSPCSVSCCPVEETDPHLSTTSLQEVVESDKVTSEPPLLQAKQPQLLQTFLIGLVLQAPHQPRYPPLDTLKHLNVLPKLRGPELDTALKVLPHQCRVQGKNDLPAPAGHTIPDAGQVPLALLATKAHCWLISNRLSSSTPRSLSA
ncbi:hypothetical protein DUI87_30249 [Hirundo rustica rustica]|uniref:Uncharacterized protein n=1 Tax=Hirundo rustica rustica TaxID=333673 RepID=A0A3M0IW85_HIRRU|nr:hypothetical protein DUI87_30249 [Hirundo rustica rustica]